MINYINLPNSCICMSSDDLENGGEYFSLNTQVWEIANTKTKTDGRGRVYLSRNLIGKEARVFVSDTNQELITCRNYVMLSKKYWIELRGIRGENAGKPLEVKSNGDIWTSQKDKYVKVFMKVVKK